MNQELGRIKAAAVIAIALVAASAWLGTRASGQEPVGDAATEVLEGAGVGETVLLVVADVVDTANAQTRIEELNSAFGELQGFYADTTDAYDLKAALVQTTPDAVRVGCPNVGALLKTTIEEELLALECPLDSASVNVLRPVELLHLARDRFASYDFPSACGTIGTPPCQRQRFVELFGDDLRMPSGKTVIATAFRTKAGAEQFVEFARSAGSNGLVVVQAFKLGGGEIGLGQEPHPDGSGPLEGPLDDQEAHQR